MRSLLWRMVARKAPGAIRTRAEPGCHLSVLPIGGFTDSTGRRPRHSRRMNDSLCTLQDAAGRVEHCPGERCPFWLDEGCGIAGLRADLYRNPSLVSHLLRLREQLAGEKQSLFRLLPPGFRA